jgi:hypothetical protein
MLLKFYLPKKRKKTVLCFSFEMREEKKLSNIATSITTMIAKRFFSHYYTIFFSKPTIDFI